VKNGSSIGQSGSNQEKTGPRSKSLANDEAKPDGEKSLEEVVAGQNKVLEVKTEIKIEAEISSRRPPNRTVQFQQLQDRGKCQGLPRPGQLQRLVGVLQASRLARGGGSSG
jgi:hypothetical protein